MRDIMPAFLISVGGKHLSLTSKVLDDINGKELLGLGSPSIKQATSSWTLLEWNCENGQFETDLAVANNGNPGMDLFLIGYITSPEPICRKSVINNPSPFLSLARNFASESAEQIKIVDSLNGSFALMSIEAQKNVIHLCSDRFASRSIWRSYHDGTWLFASHPVILWLAVGKRYAIEPASLGSLLLRARPAGDRSLLSVGCRNLPGSFYTLH